MTEAPHVLYEDNHLLILNKPCGWLVQGDQTGDKTLGDWAKDYIKHKYKKPGEVFLGVVHRLDRPVSGVIVFARTSKALSRMNELFRERDTTKIYWAIAESKPSPKEGALVHWLTKDETKNKTTVFPRETKNSLRAELHYKVLQSAGNRTLIEVNPITGRSHQIRAQLAAAGCPILGDQKYGSAFNTGDGSIALHARRLSFVHPVKKEPMLIEAQTPAKVWWQAFEGK